MERGSCMLSLFFLYYFSFTILNALFALQNFRFATLTSLGCGTIVSRTAPLECSFKIGNCLADIRRMKENSI